MSHGKYLSCNQAVASATDIWHVPPQEKKHILQTRAFVYLKHKFAQLLLEKERGALGGKVCELLELLGQRL